MDTTQKGPKISVIGAGSYFFGRQVIWKMATSPHFRGGTLALVDTDPAVLDTMMRLARRIFRETDCRAELVGSTERRDVIGDSNFIVLTFSRRNAFYRDLDTRIAARHGIRMCSSDTIGPGGIFRALREIPIVLDIAKDAEELAPECWMINFINPAATIGMALGRHAVGVRSFSLCDGNHMPHVYLSFLKETGILPEDACEIPADAYSKLDIAIGGVNHCTWLIRFNYDGRDMLPALYRHTGKLAEREEPLEKSKPRFNNRYRLKLFNLYGAYPTAISHTKEYLPFFQGYGKAPVEPEPIRLFDGRNRQKEMDAGWKVTENYADGRIPGKQFLKETSGDHATDIMESMWACLDKPFYINTWNNRAVTNLPDDAFLELLCDIDRAGGPRPRPIGPFPRGLLSMQHQLLDTHELTVEAAVTGNRSVLRKAMMTDPIVNNIEDGDACIRDFLEEEREALPGYWFK